VRDRLNEPRPMHRTVHEVVVSASFIALTNLYHLCFRSLRSLLRIIFGVESGAWPTTAWRHLIAPTMALAEAIHTPYAVIGRLFEAHHGEARDFITKSAGHFQVALSQPGALSQVRNTLRPSSSPTSFGTLNR